MPQYRPQLLLSSLEARANGRHRIPLREDGDRPDKASLSDRTIVGANERKSGAESYALGSWIFGFWGWRL